MRRSASHSTVHMHCEQGWQITLTVAGVQLPCDLVHTANLPPLRAWMRTIVSVVTYGIGQRCTNSTVAAAAAPAAGVRYAWRMSSIGFGCFLKLLLLFSVSALDCRSELLTESVQVACKHFDHIPDRLSG